MRKKIYNQSKECVGFCNNPETDGSLVLCNIVTFRHESLKKQNDLFGKKFTIESMDGVWEFCSSPVMFEHPEFLIASNYGPASPIRDGYVEFRKSND